MDKLQMFALLVIFHVLSCFILSFFEYGAKEGWLGIVASAQESHGSVADGVRVLGEGPLRILGGQCSTMPYKTLKSKDKSLKRVFNHVL